MARCLLCKPRPLRRPSASSRLTWSTKWTMSGSVRRSIALFAWFVVWPLMQTTTLASAQRRPRIGCDRDSATFCSQLWESFERANGRTTRAGPSTKFSASHRPRHHPLSGLCQSRRFDGATLAIDEVRSHDAEQNSTTRWADITHAVRCVTK